MTPETARLTSEIEAEREKLRDLRRNLWAHADAMADLRVAETMLGTAESRLRAGWPTKARSALACAKGMRMAAMVRRAEKAGGGA